jgi:hypothetical protein
VAVQTAKAQIKAKQVPQNTRSFICSPAYRGQITRTTRKDTQKMNDASAPCHELPPNEEKMIVSLALYQPLDMHFKKLVPLLWHDGNPQVGRGTRHQILLPHYAQKQRSCRQHHSQVWELPVPRIFLQIFNNAQIKWMIGCTAHGIVGDADWTGSTEPSRISSQRIKTTMTSLETCVSNEEGRDTKSRSRYVPP